MGFTPRTPRVITLTIPGVLQVGSSPARWYNRTGGIIVLRSVAASVGLAPAGAAVIADVNLDGTTIFTDQAKRPTVASGAVSGPNSTPAVTAVPNGSYLTVDVDQVGSTTAGADLVVQVMF